MSSPDSSEALSAPSFELPNVGVGPETLSLDDLIETVDFAVLVLLRDYRCPKCKRQVREVTKEAQAFSEMNTVVLPVLPEPVDRAQDWQDAFDLPFPLLADPSKEIAEKYDQPTQYGALGKLHDLLGRLPETVILDTRGDAAEIVYTLEGESIGDRPDVRTLLDEIEGLQQSFVFDCSLVDC